MQPKRSKETLWLSIIMSAVFVSLAVAFVRNNRDPAEQIASMNERIEMIHAMRLALAESSEAQNNAVMATRDLESQRFFDEARKASGKFQDLTAKLVDRLRQNSDPSELELVKRMEQAFTNFQSIDKQISELDIQNSNGKALELAFGPASIALQEIDDRLNSISVEYGMASPDRANELMRWTSDARIRLLRIQTLFAPHIAEESDEKMNEIEQRIANEDKGVQQDFESLASVLSGDLQNRLTDVSKLYADFLVTKAEIIRLSRENTSLRSVAIALNEKRDAMLACQDTLVAIEKAIRKEKVASMIPSGRGQ